MISGAVLSIADYGASPTASAAVNTAAIQAAMVAATNPIYASVFIPTGIYDINDTIIIPIAINIFGAGQNSSMLRTSVNKAIFQFGADGAAFVKTYISDMGFIGDADSAKSLQYGFYANSAPTGYVAYCVFERLTFYRLSGNAMRFTGGNSTGLINNTFSNINITQCQADCVRLSGFTSANAFNHVSFQDSQFSGVSFVNYASAQTTYFNQCAFEALGGIGSGVACYGVYAEAQIGGGGPQFSFNQCYFEKNSGSVAGAGIYVEKPFSLVVNGGVFASLPNAIWVNGDGANVVIDGGYFLATTSITTTVSFIKFTNSDVTSRSDIRQIDFFQNIGTSLTTADYIVYDPTWLGVKNGIIDYNFQRVNRMKYLQQDADDTSTLATNADASLGIASGGSGIVTVYDKTTGYAGVFFFYASAVVLGSVTSGTLFSITKDTASKINVYPEAGLLRIQNKTASNPLSYSFIFTQYIV